MVINYKIIYTVWGDCPIIEISYKKESQWLYRNKIIITPMTVFKSEYYIFQRHPRYTEELTEDLERDNITQEYYNFLLENLRDFLYCTEDSCIYELLIKEVRYENNLELDYNNKAGISKEINGLISKSGKGKLRIKL